MYRFPGTHLKFYHAMPKFILVLNGLINYIALEIQVFQVPQRD
jgi:hypothetical protein